MSVKAIETVFTQSTSKGTNRLILTILAFYANDDMTGAMPYAGRLAKDSGMTTRSVYLALQALQEAGELEIGGPSPYGTPNFVIRFKNAVTGPMPPDAFGPRYNKEPIPKDLRWQVWERDNFTCRRCGTRQHLAVDHIIPESKGGPTTLDNLQTLCKSCNNSKKDRLVGEDWYE